MTLNWIQNYNFTAHKWFNIFHSFWAKLNYASSLLKLFPIFTKTNYLKFIIYYEAFIRSQAVIFEIRQFYLKKLPGNISIYSPHIVDVNFIDALSCHFVFKFVFESITERSFVINCVNVIRDSLKINYDSL